jgi:hypothetical protein
LISAERSPKRARLTRSNLRAHEANLNAMGRRQRNSSGGGITEYRSNVILNYNYTEERDVSESG